MAFDVTGLGAQDALAQIAKMAYGSGRNEGVTGGKGNIGLVDGQVVKFNTHWTERLKSTTDEMRASCDELRRKLGTIAGELLASPGEENPDVAAAKRETLANIRRQLGLDPEGQAVVSTRLLDRKIVAAVVTQLAEVSGQNVWIEAENAADTLSSRGVDTTFEAVRVPILITRVRADRMSAEQSIPRAAMNAHQLKAFADSLCTFGEKSVQEFFKGSLEGSYSAAEKDLPRGQKTVLGGVAFGGEDGFEPQQSGAYRQSVAQMFAGHEGLHRLFNGIAHQGFLMSAFNGRMAAFDNVTSAIMQNCCAPFGAQVDQDYTFSVNRTADGQYEIDFSFTRRGDRHVTPTGQVRALDKARTCDHVEAKIVFGLAQPGDPNARTLTYKDDQGQDQTLTFHLEVVSAESEVTLAFKPF